MATNHNATAFAGFVGQSPPAYGGGHFAIYKFHCDMAAIAAELAATVDGSASDTLDIWDIPLGTMILGVFLDVTKVEGTAATVAIGDNDNSSGYLAASSINAVAKYATIVTDTWGAAHMIYKAAKMLRLLFATAADIDLAVFDVYVYALVNQNVFTPQ